MSTNWLNPLNKLMLMRAVRAGETQVKLPNGPTLSIDYRDDDLIWITPLPAVEESSFVPCGFFHKRAVLNFQFLED